ncbi:MAG: isoleucine--tRNA ligase [Candidatus Dasytiphilus stammeri]
MNDYKLTLNLPETKFPMRGNLAKKEPEILKNWNKENLYSIIRQAKKGKKIFILHDGPPYANGKLHVGHALNKILKDIIIKMKGLAGFDAPYVPGWDCHGLPIELNVENKIGKPLDINNVVNFINSCRIYAAQQINDQKNDFMRMGVLGDWNNPYLTMNFHHEANIIRVLGKLIAKGYVFKGAKPVYWCINCCSTLSDAEVEYKEIISPAIDVVFNAVDIEQVKYKFAVSQVIGPISLVIWTTTPWTLPANQAIALHANAVYILVQIKDKAIIIAKCLLQKVMTRIGVSNWQVLGEILGAELELMHFYHPFMNFSVPVVLHDHVVLDVGTGIVHIAPNHGLEDFIIGKKYNMQISNVIEPNGCYKAGTYHQLDGIQIFKANDSIINILNNNGALLHYKNIEHNYPHCWRHKTPIIFRATTQWFINMDHKKLREKAIKEISKIKWIPKWGKVCMETMVKNRPDWCISRQRTWGVPIPLFINKINGQLHPRSLSILELVANRIERAGLQAWWDLSEREILNEYECNQYIKVSDTLDVWFDSGATNSSVIEQRAEFNRLDAADMYLEGADQHRGWFMSSLIISTALKHKAPCKEILIHGFAVDGHGRKMSKSVGNTISPQTIMKKLGSDILRIWIASTDYSKEIAISEDIMKRSIDIYRRIRNTVRFLLANLNGFHPKKHSISLEQMIIIDRWILSRTKNIQEIIITAYEKYEFHYVVHILMQFCSVELGSFYLDIIKDRQYTTKKNSIARRSCQTAIFNIIECMVRWLAPIISFTADEIWQFIPGKRAPYVFTEEWFNNELWNLNDNEIMNDNFWNDLLKVRNEINKALEIARKDKKIKESLSAALVLYASGSIEKKLKSLGTELKFLFLTSSAKVLHYELAPKKAYKSNTIKNLKFIIDQAVGIKCARCWHYAVEIGNNKEYPTICNRCITNTIGYGEERRFI